MQDVGGLIEAIEQIFTVFSVTAVYPELYRPFFWLASKIGTPDKGIPYMQKWTDDRINERMSNIGDQPKVAQDQMTLFVRKHNKDPERFTFTNISVISIGSYIAGSDSTSIAFSAICYHLYQYPQTLEKLRKEIDDRVASGRLSDPPTYRETLEMPYLQAVMQEAMRIHPVFSMPMERVVPAGGATIAGHWLPEGASLLLFYPIPFI
jgi:cytochrome P450